MANLLPVAAGPRTPITITVAAGAKASIVIIPAPGKSLTPDCVVDLAWKGSNAEPVLLKELTSEDPSGLIVGAGDFVLTHRRGLLGIDNA